MFRPGGLAILACAASLFATQPSVVHDAEDFERPGVLHFVGVSAADEVRIDGELVPAKGLARVNYRLLVAPGKYVVAVKLASSGKECLSRVTVAPGASVQPGCDAQSFASMAD
jgi:hypothetical protein